MRRPPFIFTVAVRRSVASRDAGRHGRRARRAGRLRQISMYPRGGERGRDEDCGSFGRAGGFASRRLLRDRQWFARLRAFSISEARRAAAAESGRRRLDRLRRAPRGVLDGVARRVHLDADGQGRGGGARRLEQGRRANIDRDGRVGPRVAGDGGPPGRRLFAVVSGRCESGDRASARVLREALAWFNEGRGGCLPAAILSPRCRTRGRVEGRRLVG